MLDPWGSIIRGPQPCELKREGFWVRKFYVSAISPWLTSQHSIDLSSLTGLRDDMTSPTASDGAVTTNVVLHTESPGREKISEDVKHVECASPVGENLMYDNDEEEPQLHARTYFALAAMFLLNLVQVFALQAPPAVVCRFVVNLTLGNNSMFSLPILEKISTTQRLRHGCRMPSLSSKQFWLLSLPLHLILSKLESRSWSALPQSHSSALQLHLALPTSTA